MSQTSDIQLPGLWSSPMDNPQARFSDENTFHATSGEYFTALINQGLHDIYGPVNDIKISEANTYTKQLTADEANDQFGVEGDLKFDKPISIGAARIIHDNKIEELQRREALGRSPNFATTAAGVPLSLGVALVDPLGLALLAVPGVGEEQILAKFGRAASLSLDAAQTVKVATPVSRLITGAASGAQFMIPYEAARFYSAAHQHQDMEGSDALKNILYGTLLGAGLHTGLGLFEEAKVRAKEYQFTTAREIMASMQEQDILNGFRSETRQAIMEGSISDFLSGKVGGSAAELAMLDHNLHLREAERNPEILAKYPDLVDKTQDAAVPLGEKKGYQMSRAEYREANPPPPVEPPQAVSEGVVKIKTEYEQRIELQQEREIVRAIKRGDPVSPAVLAEHPQIRENMGARTYEEMVNMSRDRWAAEARTHLSESQVLRKQQMRDEITALAQKTTQQALDDLKQKVLSRVDNLQREVEFQGKPLFPEPAKEQMPVNVEDHNEFFRTKNSQLKQDFKSVLTEEDLVKKVAAGPEGEMTSIEKAGEAIKELQNEKGAWDEAVNCILHG